MKFTQKKVIQMTLLLFVFTILSSCSKDSDLLLDSVLFDSEVSLEEKRRLEEEVSEDGLVTRTFTFSPTNDAYLQNEQGHDQTIIRLQEDYRTSYLMFDLSQVNGTITDVVLQFSIDSDEGNGGISIHKGLATDWTEENLTINNAPGIEMQLANMNKAYKMGAPEKITLNSSNIAAEIITLVMTHSTGNDLAFASKEHPSNKGPKLTVTYKAPEGSPFIDVPEEDTTPQENNTTTEEENSNPNTASTEGAYYVTTSGKASNNGRSEATAWNIEHAFETAIAGDIVYIKAGNYGNKELVVDNSGNSNKPIKFIGYTNSPGDLESIEKSTFNYGDQLDSSKMPFLSGNYPNSDVAINIQENHIEIANIQITNFTSGIISEGNNITIKNAVITQLGEQSNNSVQNGKGIQIHGDNTIISNSFILNSNSEGINLKGSNNSLVENTKVYSDNILNPTGYYIIISGNGKNNIIDNCIAYRDPRAKLHQGHGIIIKDKGSENIIRGCSTYNTGYEVNFSGVMNNTFMNSNIYGSFSEYPGQFSCIISIMNGAHHNTFKDIYIEDSRYAIKFHDFDDGFKASDADRDKQEGGHNNKFINIEVNKAQNAIAATSREVGANAFSENNEFINCKFKNITSIPFFSYQSIKNTKIINCTFEDIPYSNMIGLLEGGSFEMSFQNCDFINVGFNIPN